MSIPYQLCIVTSRYQFNLSDMNVTVVQPSNVLVTLSGRDRIETVHIADFGVASFVDESGKLPTLQVGTLPFIAPELELDMRPRSEGLEYTVITRLSQASSDKLRFYNPYSADGECHKMETTRV